MYKSPFSGLARFLMERENTITPKSGLRLRKIGNRYMIVEAAAAGVNLANVYSMNVTAAHLWEALAQGKCHTPEELAQDLCRTYGIDAERALCDVEIQLEEWRRMGLLV